MKQNKPLAYIRITDIDGNETETEVNGNSQEIIEMIANAIVNSPEIPLDELLLSGIYAASVWRKIDVLDLLERVRSSFGGVKAFDKH